MTIDERAFLEKIAADRDDDDSRLVYADWLDENGQSSAAEYLRHEVAVHRAHVRLPQLAAALPAEWLDAVSRRRSLVLVTVDPQNVILTIKNVREVMQVGLKDAKDIVDAVRAGKGPLVLLTDLEPDRARQLARIFDESRAIVRIDASRLPSP